MLNSVVKITMMSAKYFEYYTIMLRGGRFFVDTLYIHFQRLLPPDRILPGPEFTLRSSLAFSYIGSITTRHSSSGHQPNGVVQGME